MSNGRLESLIRVPTGGYSGTIDDSGGGAAVAWTLPAGDYFFSDLIVELADALNVAAPTDTLTVAASLGEGGTGKVSITSTGNASLVWTDAGLRDLLGYDANLTLVAGVANTGNARARSVWLADCAYDAPNEVHPWVGWREVDGRSSESAAGDVYSTRGGSKRATWLRWNAVARSRASEANESTVNESFERFLIDGVWGEAEWGTLGEGLRFYPDASASEWVEYAVVLPEEFVPEHFFDGWAGGPWRCQLKRLVYQDASDDRGAPAAALLTSGSSTTDATSIATASISPGSNRALYAAVLAAGATDVTPTCTGCGVTWVQEKTLVVSASSNRRLTIFRAMGTPSTGALTFDFGGTSMFSWAWSVVECTDVDTGGSSASVATRQSPTNTVAAGTSLTGTLAALEHANNLHLAFFGASVGTGIGNDANFAELMDLGTSSAAIRLETQWAVGQATCTATVTADIGVVSLEVKAS